MKQTILIAVVALLFPVLIYGQDIVVKKAVSDSQYPQITWFTTGGIDTTEFQIFRATVKNKKFEEIKTSHFAKPSETSDTEEFTMVDTTLTQKGLYVYYIQVERGGHQVKSEAAYGHNFGLLPEPHFTSFKAVPLKDRKAVRLEWHLDYPQTVSSLTLFRSRSYEKGYIKISDLPADTNRFTDVVPVANEPWFYFMVINDYFGNKTPSVRIPAFATFSEKPIRPQNIHSHFHGDTIFLDWKNTGNNIVGYRVYRSLDGSPFRLANAMTGTVSEKSFFTDVSPEMKKALKAKYYVRTVSDGFVESNSSDTLDFYFAEHEPVLPPQTIDNVNDKNGNVKLIWIPSKKGLTLGYNVYLTEANGKAQLLTKNPVKNNAFTDTVYRKEGKYRYQVEGVGVNNRTSKNKTDITVYHYNPVIHVILNITKRKDGLSISWKRPLNSHVSNLTLYKQTGNNKAVVLKRFPNKNDYLIVDKNVVHNTTYLYKLVATMQNGDEKVVNKGVEMRW